MELAAGERDRGPRERRAEVHDHRDRAVKLGDDRRQRPPSEDAVLRHEHIGAEERPDDEGDRPDDVERPGEDPNVPGDRLADGHARLWVERVGRVEGRADDGECRDE